MSMRALLAVLWLGLCGSEFVAAAESAQIDGLAEVVVTAQRRAESVQDVGIAMSVLSGDSLAAKAISGVSDLKNAVPSLQVEPAFGSSQPQFRLRGIGFIDYTSNNTSPVGVSLDGVAFALPIQTQGLLFDVERIEVLRGPQGTLYGRNSTGGVINFISNRPTADTHAGLSVEYGSHNEVAAEGFVSGTLAPALTGRLSVATEQGGAWQHDRLSGLSLGDKDKVAVRGQLQFDPIERVELRLGLHYARDKSDEQGLYLLAPYPDIPNTPPALPADTNRYATGWNLRPAFAALTGLKAGAKPGLNDSNSGVDLSGDVDLGFAKITSITAYNKLIRREYGDWDATQFADSDEYLNSDFDQFSQELRLASAPGRLEWVLGGIYSHEDLLEDFYSDLTNRLGGIALTTYEQAANSLGVFGQASFKFSDEWKLTLGAREDHESRELIGLNTGFVNIVPSFTGGPLSRGARSNLPSGKIELDYKPVADTLVYASVSRGVKSGGFTAHNTVSAPAVDPFQPERLTAYELGAKADVARSLRINGALYYYRYRDQQILGKVFDDASQSFIGRFTNANSRIHGAELELEWLPLAGLSLSQYAGFVEGYYTSSIFNGAIPPADYNGRALSFPKWSYGGDASYVVPIGGYKFTGEVNYSFHDTYSQFFLLGSNDFTVPRYWLANANLTLAPSSGGPWTVGLWGRNIFNRRYDLTRNFFLPSSEVAAAGAPATFGIRLTYKY